MAKLLCLWIIIKSPHIYTMQGQLPLFWYMVLYSGWLFFAPCSLHPPIHSACFSLCQRLTLWTASTGLLLAIGWPLFPSGQQEEPAEGERQTDQGWESGQRGEMRVHSPCWPCRSSSCGAPPLQGSGWQWLISSGLSQGASNLISFLPNSHL